MQNQDGSLFAEDFSNRRKWGRVTATLAGYLLLGLILLVVVGASVGAVVGGALASGNLATFEEWVLSLGRVDIIRLLDAKMTGGGFLQGKSLMGAIGKQIGDPKIEELDIPFACVATELGSAREVISRLLKDFESRGWVKLSRGSINILDKQSLEKLAAM